VRCPCHGPPNSPQNGGGGQTPGRRRVANVECAVAGPTIHRHDMTDTIPGPERHASRPRGCCDRARMSWILPTPLLLFAGLVALLPVMELASRPSLMDPGRSSHKPLRASATGPARNACCRALAPGRAARTRRPSSGCGKCGMACRRLGMNVPRCYAALRTTI
jgi:hypothetical protein